MKRRPALHCSDIHIHTINLQDRLNNRQVTSDDGKVQNPPAMPVACVHVDAWRRLLQNSPHRRQIASRDCSTELRFHSCVRVIRLLLERMR